MTISYKKTILLFFTVILFTFHFVKPGIANSSIQQNDDTLSAASMHKAATQVLKPVYPYLARYVTDTFALSEKRGTGIDIGGGAGDLVAELCCHTPKMYWISSDINPCYFPYVHKKAQKKHCLGRVGFIRADATDLPFKSNFADVIVSRASFHFWEDMKKGFSEIKRVLKPGGQALVGRGFPPNMPVDTARAIRNKQDKKITGYDPDNFANDFNEIMNNLNINDYKIIIPKPEASVQYGIWILFRK